ncbi:MAG: CDP-glycerol glycerophosphotransferase family protein [Candidatus Limnocylindrus sp.]|jgi:CDP-glycerol glycerophosphotransferase (TagB/SpsB family)
MGWLEYLLAGTAIRIVGTIARLLPVDARRVLFATPRGRELNGALAAARDAVHTLRPNAKVTTLAEPYGYGLAAKFGYLLRVLRGAWLVRRSGVVIVDNAYLPVHLLAPRRGQRIAQVWHASGALKRFGHAAQPAPRGPEARFLHRGYTDAFVGGEAARSPYAAAFRMDASRVHAIGSLRAAPLANAVQVAARRAELLSRYPQIAGRKLLLYAPTFRGRGESRSGGGVVDLAALRAALPREWAIGAKGHPGVATDFAAARAAGSVDLIFDRADEVESLFPIADALLTDYSASIFEWSLLLRPLVLFVPDLADYQTTPGLFPDLEREAIGDLVRSEREAAAAVAASRVDPAAWRDFAERHLGTLQQFTDAPRRLVEILLPESSA